MLAFSKDKKFDTVCNLYVQIRTVGELTLTNILKHLISVAFLGSILGITAPVGAAQASLFNFSYEFSTGDVLSGQFDGTISSGDANILEVGSVISASFNGTAGPALTYVDSTTNYYTSSGTPAKVSFDGSVMDILASTSPCCGDGFVFLDASLAGGSIPINTGPSFGSFGIPPDDEFFDAGRWSLTAFSPVATVPLPATLPLFSSALGIFGLVRWRGRGKRRALSA